MIVLRTPGMDLAIEVDGHKLEVYGIASGATGQCQEEPGASGNAGELDAQLQTEELFNANGSPV
jgi:hypothetical protein